MKTILLMLASIVVLSAGCKKKETATPTVNVIYEVQSSAPQVRVTYSAKVIREGDNMSVNNQVWEITAPGTYTRTVELEKGQSVEVNGLSTTSGDYKLLVRDAAGTILQQTDTMAFYPANQLHPDEYVTRIVIPSI